MRALLMRGRSVWLLSIVALILGTFAISAQRAEAVPDGPGEWVGSITIAKSDISGFYDTYLVTTTFETVAGGAYGATVMDTSWDGKVDWTRSWIAPCDGIPTLHATLADYGESDENGSIRIEWQVSNNRWLMQPDPGTNYIIDGSFSWEASCEPFPNVYDNELVPAFSVFDEVAPQAAQILVGSADIPNGTAPYTAEWRFWRANCDETVDTDSGGEGDCEEVRDGRDPFDPADDLVVTEFIDDDGHVFENAIEWLAAEGITKGCNPPVNTLFCPDDNVTRGQMAAFLVRALGYDNNGGGGIFSDTIGHTFEGAIDKLATAGVTKGCNPPSNTQFCPNDFVTRGQMAAFLVRALGYTDDGIGDLFTDDDGHIFEAAIDKLGTAGVTKGCNPPTNTMFCPDELVTRAQMAGFLKRALE